jgi:hypothetical protein
MAMMNWCLVFGEREEPADNYDCYDLRGVILNNNLLNPS